MMDWMARTLELPKHFLSDGEGGGVIQVRGGRAHLSTRRQKKNGSRSPRAPGVAWVEAGGTQGTASEAVIVTMLAARTRAVNQHGKDDRITATKLVAYWSSQAHSSVQKAAMVANVQFRVVPVLADFTLDVAQLSALIEVRTLSGVANVLATLACAEPAPSTRTPILPPPPPRCASAGGQGGRADPLLRGRHRRDYQLRRC